MTGSIPPPRHKRSRSRRPPSKRTKANKSAAQLVIRNANRADGRCQNDDKAHSHGPVINDGCRCAPCDATHMASSHRIPVSARFAGVKRAKFEDAIRRALDAAEVKVPKC